MKVDDNARTEFWKTTEEEVGEPILSFAMGAYFPEEGAKRPVFGLLFLTKTRIHFRHFAKESWLQVGKKSKEISFEIELEGRSLIVPPKLGWFRRLVMGHLSKVFQLVRSPSTGGFSFTVENNESEFVSTLTGLVGSSRAEND